VSPLFVALLMTLGAASAPSAAAAVVVVTTVGVCTGVVAALAFPQTSLRRPVVPVLIVVLLLAPSFVHLRQVATGEWSETSLLWSALLGAPAGPGILTGSGGSWLVGLAVMAVWSMLAVVLVNRLPVTASRSTHHPVALRLGARPGPWRVEVLRQLRNRRTRSSLACAYVVAVAVVVVLPRMEALARDALAELSATLLGILLAYPALQVRGLADRTRPVALVLGQAPVRWAALVVSASAAVCLPAGVGVAAYFLVAGVVPAPVAFGMVAVVVSSWAAGAAIGAIQVPGRGDAATELVGVIVSVLLAGAIGRLAAAAVGDGGLPDAAPLIVAASLLLCLVPLVAEKVRWRQQLGGMSRTPLVTQGQA